jgi:hypothetical protein
MVYRTWDKMGNQQAILAQAEAYLLDIEQL